MTLGLLNWPQLSPAEAFFGQVFGMPNLQAKTTTDAAVQENVKIASIGNFSF